jgi:hypothetical protein
MNWPAVAELEDITISPLVDGSSKGNLRIAANPPTPFIEHFRYGTKESALEISQLTAADAPAVVIDEPTIYGGLLFRHFGHLLTESIHRLWPRYALKELHGARVAFHPVNNTKIMPYMTEALNFHGFSKSQVIPINETILFKRLFVGPQARTLAGPTIIPAYQSMLDRDLSRRLSPPCGNRKLYVSRRSHQHTGSYYGESFVQEALGKVGFEIIYPEQHSLTDLVTMLRAASIAIFAEGSAVHALELCGSKVPATAIISRRPKSRRRFSPLLSTICERWMIADHVMMTAGLGADAKKHSGVLNLPALARDLEVFTGLPSRLGTSDEMLRGIERDLEAHIFVAASDRTVDYHLRAAELRKLVRGSAMHSMQVRQTVHAIAWRGPAIERAASNIRVIRV